MGPARRARLGGVREGAGGEPPLTGAFLTQVVLREWLMTPLVLVLAVLPGLGFATLAVRRVRLSWAVLAALGFAVTVAAVSLVATLAYVAGWPLQVVYTAHLMLLLPASIALLVRAGRAGWLDALPLGAHPLLLAGAAALVAMVERPWFRSDADSFYHMAATRSLLATNRPLVTDPFLGTATRALDPTSGVLHTLQALFSRVLGADVSTLYMGVMALGTAAVVLGFWLLARSVARTDAAATIATVAMAGVAYHFDFRVLAYPKHVSEGLLFLALALIVRLLDEPEWPLAALAVVAGVATVTMHLVAAEFLFVAGAFLVAALAAGAIADRVRGLDARWPRPLAYVTLTGLAIALLSLPVLLPRVGALAGTALGADHPERVTSQLLTLGPVTIVRPGAMYTGGWMLTAAALVLFALALRPAYCRRASGALAVVALAAIAPTLLHDPVVTPLALRAGAYSLARLAALMRFMPFVAVAWALGESLPGREKLLPRLGALAIAVAVIAALPDLYTTVTGVYPAGFQRGLDVYGLGATYAEDIRATWGPGTIARMGSIFGRSYPVVAAEPRTGYYLAGIEPVAIVAPELGHAPAAIETASGQRRRADMAEFFDQATSETRRLEIVRRWNVRYVAVWKDRLGPEVEKSLLRQALFRPVVTSPRFDLLEVVTR